MRPKKKAQTPVRVESTERKPMVTPQVLVRPLPKTTRAKEPPKVTPEAVAVTAKREAETPQDLEDLVSPEQMTLVVVLQVCASYRLTRVPINRGAGNHLCIYFYCGGRA